MRFHYFLLAMLVFFSSSCINSKDSSQDDLKNKEIRIDESLFEIIHLTTSPVVSNYHIHLKKHTAEKDSVENFIKRFRAERCFKECNIYIYDSKDITELIIKYPLEGEDYIDYADHLVASSSFDAPESVWWYPFKDERYKEYKSKK